MRIKENNTHFHTQTREETLEGLQQYGQVPDFSLVERSGKNISLIDLTGKIWIADFIYTNCPDTCPLQSANMAALQKDFLKEKDPILSLLKDIRFVSISIDPERDTSLVLTQYAERYGADPNQWFFLTGEKGAIYRLAQEGFHVNAAEILQGKRGPDGASHIHGGWFILVDRQAQIRGYYLGTDVEALQRLLRDVKILATETQRTQR
jgi:protein SCO1/2